jgi:hypothetical protein
MGLFHAQPTIVVAAAMKRNIIALPKIEANKIILLTCV